MYELLECRKGALCGSIHNRYISNLAIEVVHVFKYTMGCSGIVLGIMGCSGIVLGIMELGILFQLRQHLAQGPLFQAPRGEELAHAVR